MYGTKSPHWQTSGQTRIASGLCTVDFVKKLKATLAATTLAVAAYCAPAMADVSINWQTTSNALSQEVLQRSNVISDFTQLMDTHLISTPEHKLDKLKVTINEEPGPHVNFASYELVIPYHYLSYAIKSHAELEETREAALERGINTVEFTLYHLFGLFIAQDNNSDDAAEALSSWLMIKAFSNGGEQWLANAEAFGRASQLLDGPVTDYWHEHSLYKSRQRKINCWILGSSPERYEDLLKPVLEQQQRTQRCIKEWNQLDLEMQKLLRDNIVTGSRLLR